MVRFWYTDFGQDDQHPLAQALRPNAKPSQLPGSPHTAEHALRAMLDEAKPREALQRVQQWRWQAVVRAQLTEEIEAVKALGALHQRHGDIDAAIECFIRAGAGKQAAAAAASHPDVPCDLSTSTLTPVETCRAAAYMAVAAMADLLTDDQAREWGDAALAEIADANPSERLFGPSARLRALDALAALADTLPDEHADELLRHVERLIDRPADHYMHTDEAVAKILLSMAAKRSDAVPLLVRALVADQRMASIISGRADILRANRDTIAELLVPAAADNQHACLALILAGADPTPASKLARKRVDQDIAPRDHQPGTITYYAGAPETAILASVLDRESCNHVARTMLDRALDRQEATLSRRDSLKGLTNIVADADDDTREAILPLGAGPGSGSVAPLDGSSRSNRPRATCAVAVDIEAVDVRPNDRHFTGVCRSITGAACTVNVRDVRHAGFVRRVAGQSPELRKLIGTLEVCGEALADLFAVVQKSPGTSEAQARQTPTRQGRFRR
jgi:hypothetical protein